MDFYLTRMGAAFFDGTVPRIAKALERIAEALEKQGGPPPDAVPLSLAILGAEARIRELRAALSRISTWDDDDDIATLADFADKALEADEAKPVREAAPACPDLAKCIRLLEGTRWAPGRMHPGMAPGPGLAEGDLQTWAVSREGRNHALVHQVLDALRTMHAEGAGWMQLLEEALPPRKESR